MDQHLSLVFQKSTNVKPFRFSGGGKECDVVEEVKPAALEASAHWTPGPWGPCRVAIEQPAAVLPGKYHDSQNNGM